MDKDLQHNKEVLKKALFKFWLCLGIYFGVAILGNFSGNKQMDNILGGIMLIFLLGVIFYRFVTIFKIRPVLEGMKMRPLLYQLGMFFIPLGETLITLFVLNQAKKYLRQN